MGSVGNTSDAWNSLAAGSWRRSPEQEWFHDYLLYPAICERLAPGSHILDYGCGSGELLALARHHGHDVVGLDPSAEMVRRAAAQNPGVRIVTHPGLLGSDSFDAVVMNLVLSCVDDPVAVASAAAAHAARLIVTLPHPCFSLYEDLHYTTRRRWTSARDTSDVRELYFRQPTQAVVWDEAGATTTLYHRSLTEWFYAFRQCRLRVVDLVEPLPIAEGICIRKLYERFTRIPKFILFDLHEEGT
jgi:SAM-dependent methyltransferase